MSKIFLKIQTKNKKEVLDITEKVNSELKKMGAGRGVCHLFLTHTTAALTTADLDQGGTDQDYLDALEKLIPRPAGGFRHRHDPSHMPDHILSSLIGTSLTLPVEDGQIILGNWQRIVLVEFDGARTRDIVASFQEDK